MQRVAVVVRLNKRLVDQVGYNLCVRVTQEDAAASHKLSLERKVVLDDTVVNHHDGSRAVGMCVFFGGTSVGRPSGMPNSHRAGDGIITKQRLQILELAFGPPHTELAVGHQSDASRVIAAVLQPPKTVEEKGATLSGPNVSNDATHADLPVAFTSP
jgi:hypothetical protein